MALVITVTLLGWAWAWVGIRAAVPHFGPGPLALGRYCIASLVLLPIWYARGRALPERGEWPGVALTGLLGFTSYNLCVNAGEKVIPAGTASMIVACIPVLTTLGAVLFFGERLAPRNWLGVVVAFGGVGLIGAAHPGGRAELAGLLLLFGGALSATGYNLLSKRYLARYSALDVTTWAIWTGTLGLLPAGGGLFARLGEAPLGAVLTLVGLGVLPGAICYTLFAWLMSRRPLSTVANLLFLIPVTAVVMGYFILGEKPPLPALAGGLVVIGGVWLVTRR